MATQQRAEGELDTLQLGRCVERWQGGDRGAADELLLAAGARLQHLTRKMLRGFPNVRRWDDTADVCQAAVIRLLATLGTVRPASTRDFYNLAAVHIRRELLDLARYYGPRNRAFPAAAQAVDGGGDGAAPPEAADAAPPADELERWCLFHQAVERLPAPEREVVGLMFYHGWTQARIAELFGMSERTVRRYWQAACLRLHTLLCGELPG